MKAKIKLNYLEEDAGLWIVRADSARSLGAIYDRGSKVSGTKVDGYDALDCWDGCVPGRLVGSSDSFMGALHVLRVWIESGSPPVKELPSYHPDVYNKELQSLPSQMRAFIRDIAQNHKDAIWQDEWFRIRARAQGLVSKFGGAQ